MSDCSSASFSRMCRAYDSDPGLGGLHMMPMASCPVTFGERLMEHSLYISSDTLQAAREEDAQREGEGRKGKHTRCTLSSVRKLR